MGADAVIGAQLKERMITMGARGKGGDDGGEVIEFTVVGTAVQARFLDAPAGATHRRPISRGRTCGRSRGRVGAVLSPLRVLPLPRVARHVGQRAYTAS